MISHLQFSFEQLILCYKHFVKYTKIARLLVYIHVIQYRNISLQTFAIVSSK